MKKSIKILLCAYTMLTLSITAHASPASISKYFIEHLEHLQQLIPCIWGEFPEVLVDEMEIIEENDLCGWDKSPLMQPSEAACICQHLLNSQYLFKKIGLNALASFYLVLKTVDNRGQLILILTDIFLLSITLDYASKVAPELKKNIEKQLTEVLARKLNQLIPTPPV